MQDGGMQACDLSFSSERFDGLVKLFSFRPFTQYTTDEKG